MSHKRPRVRCENEGMARLVVQHVNESRLVMEETVQAVIVNEEQEM